MMLVFAIAPVLVQSCHDGLRIMPSTLASVRQRDGMHLYTNSQIISDQWCSYDLRSCHNEQGDGCTIDECTHTWLVFACETSKFCPEPVYVQSTPGLMVTFVATNINGDIQSGSWCGPADWDLDGSVTSGDFYGFMGSFFQGLADHDRSGTTDSQDLFLFLDDYFGS